MQKIFGKNAQAVHKPFLRTQSNSQLGNEIQPTPTRTTELKKPVPSNYMHEPYTDSNSKHLLTTSMKNLKQDSAERAFFEL